MGTILLDLGRTILIILLLPLFVVLIGPLLVLAVFRGQQPLGPVTLDSSRYNLAGKTGILMLGLAFWLLAWSGLAWLILAALTGPPNLQVFQLRPTPVVNLATASSTPVIASPSPIVPTATEVPPTVPPTETTVVTATPRVPDQAVEATATDSTVGTPTAVQARPTGETGLLITETAALTVQPTPLEPDRSAAIAAVREANMLLEDAMNLPNEQNLAALGTVWQDRALTKVEKFAIEQHERYAKRLEATFEFISPPAISSQVSPGQLVITAQERWRYGQSVNADQETFEFIYTLNWADERWIITRYTYRNLPRSVATAGVGQATVTTTPGSR